MGGLKRACHTFPNWKNKMNKNRKNSYPILQNDILVLKLTQLCKHKPRLSMLDYNALPRPNTNPKTKLNWWWCRGSFLKTNKKNSKQNKNKKQIKSNQTNEYPQTIKTYEEPKEITLVSSSNTPKQLCLHSHKNLKNKLKTKVIVVL